jgi:glyoxalase family protein
MAFEVLEDKDDQRIGWSTPEIGQAESVRGFYGTVLSVRDVSEQEKFLIEALGFRKTGVDGRYHRFEIDSGGANKTLVLLHEPDRAPGSWTFGAGTVHHIALWVADDEAMAAQKAIYEELGYTDASEIKDRYYFHSMYVRSPGGILVECCCNVPGGFEKDEPASTLGTKLHIPPWFEDRREEILKTLEPIVAPETATSRA